MPDFEGGDFWEIAHRGVLRAYEECRDFNIGVQVVRYDQFRVESFRQACSDTLADLPDAVLIVPMFREAATEFVTELAGKKCRSFSSNRNCPARPIWPITGCRSSKAATWERACCCGIRPRRRSPVSGSTAAETRSATRHRSARTVSAFHKTGKAGMPAMGRLLVSVRLCAKYRNPRPFFRSASRHPAHHHLQLARLHRSRIPAGARHGLSHPARFRLRWSGM